MAKPHGHCRTDLRKTVFHPQFGLDVISHRTGFAKIYRWV